MGLIFLTMSMTPYLWNTSSCSVNPSSSDVAPVGVQVLCDVRLLRRYQWFVRRWSILQISDFYCLCLLLSEGFQDRPFEGHWICHCCLRQRSLSQHAAIRQWHTGLRTQYTPGLEISASILECSLSKIACAMNLGQERLHNLLHLSCFTAPELRWCLSAHLCAHLMPCLTLAGRCL